MLLSVTLSHFGTEWRVGPRGPAGEGVKQTEHEDSAEERVQEIEHFSAHHESEEE